MNSFFESFSKKRIKSEHGCMYWILFFLFVYSALPKHHSIRNELCFYFSHIFKVSNRHLHFQCWCSWNHRFKDQNAKKKHVHKKDHAVSAGHWMISILAYRITTTLKLQSFSFNIWSIGELTFLCTEGTTYTFNQNS